MNSESPLRSACSNEFAELCALSTTGALTADEQLRLDRHLVCCSACRELLADYRGLAMDGAAKMVSASDVDWEHVDRAWDEAAAREKLLENLHATEAKLQAGPAVVTGLRRAHSGPATAQRSFVQALLRVAALVLMSVLAGYYFGAKRTQDRYKPQLAATVVETFIPQQLAQLQSQRNALNDQLATDAKTISDLTERFSRQERELVEIKDAKNSLEAEVQRQAGENRRQAGELSSLSAQRDRLQHWLDDAEQSLEDVRDDLNRRKEEQQKGFLRAASLEMRIEELSSQLREASKTVQRQRDFLDSDRDIRELMGARQLYIADVFDVDHNGKKRAPFGRVFYTKGKSLIFYAFDLDQPPGYRNAKAFQVWGSPSEDQSKPVSLGVFYKDSEANRRWVFKTDDPETLAQINAVFVTVETNGPSAAPTSKPILYAYLRAAPTNHP